MPHTILVAEDDPDIRTLLELYLKSSGYQVRTAANGIQALEILHRQKIDLALLDIMMPEMDGYALTREIRSFSSMPVLFLTAKDQDCEKILGLDLGADGYLTKPFNPLEVVAHVRSALRRFYQLGGAVSQENTQNVLCLGPLRLDLSRMTLEKDGLPIDLTATEFKILARMMAQPGRVFTKAQLYAGIGGGYCESDDKTMMVHISNLREKIEGDSRNPRYIQTVRGLGYKIEYIP